MYVYNFRCCNLVQKQDSASGKGVQGAKPPAGERGVPASFLFPKKVY